jgi:MATE family multidrug resistance protein
MDACSTKVSLDIKRGSAITLSVKTVLREARATLLLAVPITIGQLSQVLMGVADTVMIGRTGTVPLAASSFGTSIFNVLFIVGVGLLVPVAVFASMSKGAGRHDEAGEYLRHGLLLSLVAGLAEFALIVAMGRHLAIFDQPPEVTAAVNPFLILIGFSLLPVLAYLALRQFAESMGRPWVSTIVLLAGVALNVVLNWVFIYGHLGSPPFGLTGAGIATLISRLLCTAVIFAWLRLDPSMRSAWPVRWFAPISWERMKRMLHIGVPTAGSLLFEGVAFGATTVMIGWLGAVSLAAHQVAMTYVQVTFMLALGMALATGMRLGAAVGAGEHERLRPIWIGGAGMGTAVSALLMVVILASGRGLPALFIQDQEVITVATKILFVAAVFLIFDSNNVINSAALRGLTDVKVPAVMTFVAYWVIAMPASYLLGIRWGYGPAGVWTGLAIGLFTASVCLGLRFIYMTRARPSGN